MAVGAAAHIGQVAVWVGALAGADRAKPPVVSVPDLLTVELAVEAGQAPRVQQALDLRIALGDLGLEDAACIRPADALDGGWAGSSTSAAAKRSTRQARGTSSRSR